jgi:hypothetical protein
MAKLTRTQLKKHAQGMLVQPNKVPEYFCPSCMDYGMIEICDPGTDALLGYRACTACRPPLSAFKPGSILGEWKHTAAELAALPPF